MSKSTENKEQITFDEFKAWLTGLVRGKLGQLPDLKDWKHIKIMMDKVDVPAEKWEKPPHLFALPAETMNNNRNALQSIFGTEGKLDTPSISPAPYPPADDMIHAHQAIGRGLRKAHDKDSVDIGDICCRSSGRVEEISMTHRKPMGLITRQHKIDRMIIRLRKKPFQTFQLLKEDKNGN